MEKKTKNQKPGTEKEIRSDRLSGIARAHALNFVVVGPKFEYEKFYGIPLFRPQNSLEYFKFFSCTANHVHMGK